MHERTVLERFKGGAEMGKRKTIFKRFSEVNILKYIDLSSQIWKHWENLIFNMQVLPGKTTSYIKKSTAIKTKLHL